jgi:hypothetical protein
MVYLQELDRHFTATCAASTVRHQSRLSERTIPSLYILDPTLAVACIVLPVDLPVLLGIGSSLAAHP